MSFLGSLIGTPQPARPNARSRSTPFGTTQNPRTGYTVTQQLLNLTEADAKTIGSKRSGFYLGPAKTPSGEDRVIPLPDFVIDALAAWRVAHPAITVTLPWGEPDSAKTKTSELVFGLTSKNTLGSSLKRRAAARAGATWSAHDLRKLYSQTLDEAGVPERTRLYVMATPRATTS